MLRKFTAFIPPLPVAAALIASVLLPLLLVALAHRPFRVERPGKRFCIAIILCGVAWITGVFVGASLVGPDTGAVFVVDIAAGAMILMTAVLVMYSAWTLLLFGYTVALLRTLFLKGVPVDLEEWACSYGEGAGLYLLMQDRVALITKCGLLIERGDQLILYGKIARWLAAVAQLGMRIFGLAVDKR